MPYEPNANQFIALTSSLTALAAFRLISDSNRPYIGMSLKFEANNFPTLVIENIGNRTARNIRFEISNKSEALLMQIGSKETPIQETVPFKNGIAALTPNEKAAYMFYLDPKIWDEDSSSLLSVTVTYTRKHNWNIFEFREDIMLDIKDYQSRLRTKNIPE